MGLWRAPGGTLEGPQQYHTERLWHHIVEVCLDGPPRAAKGASGAAAGAARAAVGGSGPPPGPQGGLCGFPESLAAAPFSCLRWAGVPASAGFQNCTWESAPGAPSGRAHCSIQQMPRAARRARARVRLIVLLRSPSARAFAPPFAARARVLGASGRRPGRPSCTLLSSAYAIRPPQPIELHRVPLAWPTRRGALNSDCNVGRSARQCCCRAQWLRHRAVARARLGSCGRRGARQCPSRL